MLKSLLLTAALAVLALLALMIWVHARVNRPTCPGRHLGPGEFSGGRTVPCQGVRGFSGAVYGGCDEPCSFKKIRR